MGEAGATTQNKRLVSISTLIFKAFAKKPANISRYSGYTDAVEVMTRDTYNVEIPAA